MVRGRDFSDVVYTLLIVEKVRRVEEVADAMGMTYAALHARIINRTCFSADEIRSLITEVPDARLVNYFLEESSFIPAVRLGHSEAHDMLSSITNKLEATQRGANRVIIDATDVLEIIDAGIASGKIDHRIARLALTAIDATERALASLRLMLDALR